MIFNFEDKINAYEKLLKFNVIIIHDHISPWILTDVDYWCVNINIRFIGCMTNINIYRVIPRMIPIGTPEYTQPRWHWSFVTNHAFWFPSSNNWRHPSCMYSRVSMGHRRIHTVYVQRALKVMIIVVTRRSVYFLPSYQYSEPFATQVSELQVRCYWSLCINVTRFFYNLL